MPDLLILICEGVDQGAALVGESFGAGSQRDADLAPTAARELDSAAVGRGGVGEHSVQRPVHPLHDMEGVEADTGVRHVFLGGDAIGLRSVHRYRLDRVEI
ncbi:hypothetical protein Rwratislav_38356 [Rhodococcus wratislaviensis IFP 2016]|nr:hypothetical protein Rwratislav_38356 [Rhodococcus wratislaviensis IFP 2016]